MTEIKTNKESNTALLEPRAKSLLDNGVQNTEPRPELNRAFNELDKKEKPDLNKNLKTQTEANTVLHQGVDPELLPELTSTNSSKEEKVKSPLEEIVDKVSAKLNHDYVNKFLIGGDILSMATDFFRTSMGQNMFSSMKDMLPWHGIKKFVDDWSVRLTKMTIMARFVCGGINALINKRVMEALGRIGGIIVLPLVELHDITLATGISTSVCQVDLGLEHKMDAKSKTSYKSYGESIADWFKTLTKMTLEMFSGSVFGPNGKLFPDFKMQQILDVPKRFMEDMFSGKNLKGQPGEKEEGHTAIFGGYFIGIGALIGVLFGRNARNIWNKVGGVIRNFGGILGDYSLLTHTDANMRRAGYFAGMASVIDMLQRFIPSDSILVNTINHYNLINNTIALKHYADRSENKSKGNFDAYQDLEKK